MTEGENPAADDCRVVGRLWPAGTVDGSLPKRIEDILIVRARNFFRINI